MHVLYHDKEELKLKIATVPQGQTGEQFVKRLKNAVLISNHATLQEAEAAKASEEDPPGGAIGRGDKMHG